jgi:hypothetical protein
MKAEDLLAKVKGVPFRPFRVVTKSGKAYDVTHPAYVKVGKWFWHYFFKASPDALYEWVDEMSPDDIDHFEELPEGVAPTRQRGGVDLTGGGRRGASQ